MIEGLFTLPRDIRLECVESFPEDVLARFEHEAGDFALTRPQSRTPTHVVSSSTAKLLEGFREPMTIADAVIRFSAEESADPGSVLDASFPVLQTLVESGMLLPSDSHLAAQIEFLLKPGDVIHDLVVEQQISIVLDTEVYRASRSDGTRAALKVARLGSEDRLKVALEHEARILSEVGGGCCPANLGQGEHSGRPFLAMEWCDGVDAITACELVRSRDPVNGRELMAILLAIADAYADLHERRVVHGDVHPRNLLVRDSGKVTIIDLGQARCVAKGREIRPRGRGVVAMYMEPELARRRLARRKGRPPDFAGEQYSIAAMLYFLVTGFHTHDFVLEEGKMYRQLIDEPPKTFAERAVSGFAHTEIVLRRALAKRPRARFGSIEEMRDALREALERDDGEASSHERKTRDTPRIVLLDELIDRSSLDGALLRDGVEAPSASVNLGSAGLAYGLLRIAQQRQDASLLAMADIWSQSALRDIQSAEPAAFTAADLEMSPQIAGKVSLYHSIPGVHCVAALVADAQADEFRRTQAVEQFVAAAAAEEAGTELVFGTSGLLLGCSILLDAVSSTPAAEQRPLTSLGTALSARIFEQLDRLPGNGHSAVSSTLGIAHGCSGVFYSLLKWAHVSKTAVPQLLRTQLEHLARLAQPLGRGLVWPVSTSSGSNGNRMCATWCNGAAGHLHLWLLAHELSGDPAFLSLARGAAWTSYETRSLAADLCCGSAGRAYALLRYARHTGDRIWLKRANELANHAADAILTHQLRKNSLYRGEVGVCLLAADLQDPEQARMPLFE